MGEVGMKYVTSLMSILRQQITKYKEFVSSIMPNTETFDNIWHTSYQVQKSGHYVWHHDAAVEEGKVRVLTFIWYLNTVNEGGETDFYFKNVKENKRILRLYTMGRKKTRKKFV
jgi:hypothetical protein